MRQGEKKIETEVYKERKREKKIRESYIKREMKKQKEGDRDRKNEERQD